MVSETLYKIAEETIEDLGTGTQNIPNVIRKINAAESQLASMLGRELAEDLDPDTNLSVRSWLINYARYSFYGVENEFEENYKALTRRLQIEAGI